MTGGKIMDATLKQRHNPISGMNSNTYSTRRGTLFGRRFSEPLGRLPTFNHGQLNSLPCS